jgi:hypothetical protein
MIYQKVNKLTPIAPTMTSIKAGSQSLDMVRNPKILDLLHIPLITSPRPNKNPIHHEIGISHFAAVVSDFTYTNVA